MAYHLVAHHLQRSELARAAGAELVPLFYSITITFCSKTDLIGTKVFRSAKLRGSTIIQIKCTLKHREILWHKRDRKRVYTPA